MSTVNIFTALIAGFLSFLSPCVLPLVPAYISYISGISISSLQEEEARKRAIKKIIVNALFFIMGFSIIFILLGASASFVGRLLATYKSVLEKIAGIIIIIFGIHLTSIFRIKYLDYEKRIAPKRILSNPLSILLLGSSFAFGWTPCIGPILGSILALAAAQATLTQGITLLIFYSLGLGIPFFLSAIFTHALFTFLTKFKNYFRIVEIISGILLILVGILVFTGNFFRLASFFPQLALQF